MRLNKEQYLATQAIHYPGFTIGGGAEPLAMLATLWLLLLTPANSPAFWWTLTSLLGIAAMHAVFWTVTQPVNKFWVSGLKPKGASAAFLGPVEPKATIGEGYEVQWQASRNQWEYSHLGRAILSAISLISLAIAVALQGKGWEPGSVDADFCGSGG